ncbi:hypothetical protein B0H12DRAFT_1148214 [Mycena haematopus]|nr:hypothetical protein B0H12DRAFT_1148214 [Mycena haematopus]
MDDQPHVNAEFTHSTTYTAGSTSHGSGMFSHSRDFTVTGQNFINITNNKYTTPSTPSDFRMIPMGDIDLRHEIRVDKRTGAVNYDRHQARVRRMYSARVQGRKSALTVAMYQGNGAEEEWRHDIAKYMAMRHPNIIQITGAASSGGIHATMFNDDLVPLSQFLDHHGDSPVSTVYIYACCTSDFSEVSDYINSAFQQKLSPAQCTKWIRRSTGRLCTVLESGDSIQLSVSIQSLSGLQGLYTLDASHTEPINMLIQSLTLEQYHQICYFNLIQKRSISIPTFTAVNVRAVFSCSSGDVFEDLAVIADNDWESYPPWINSKNWEYGTVMENGWTR